MAKETKTQPTGEARRKTIFDMKTANQWMDVTKVVPMPKALVGDLWLEGELAILFGETGVGKSVLAVQIAECIARSTGLEPFENTARRQPVIHLDFQSSAKQFEMRYAEKRDGGDFLTDHYSFSDDYHRVHVDLCGPVPDGCGSFHEYIYEGVKEAAAATGARVLIVDNITQFKRSNDIVRDMLPMMRQLSRLKHELGMSVLVLAQTTKRDTSRPVTLADLNGARPLANFADNIFALGGSILDPARCYIKHIGGRSTRLFYGASRVASFRVEKIGGNFLGFMYESVVAENSHLCPASDRPEWEIIDRIKDLSDDGKTVREIAAELGISKTTVGRLRQTRVPFDPTTHPSYFPGCEEYDAARQDPRFNTMYENEDEADYRLRREYNILENARYEARREYKKTGQTPPFAEMLKRQQEIDAARRKPRD